MNDAEARGAERRRARAGLGRVRLDEVAAVAGVSPVTVSRTLRRPDTVAERTRQRVLLAVESTGYIPDLVAGSLASERTGQIAIIVPSFSTPAFVGTIRGISEFLLPRGFQFVLGDRNLSGDNELSLLAAMLGRRMDAVILADVVQSPAARLLLERSHVPVVETWTLSEHPVGMNVGFDNRAAARDVTRHLLQVGRRRIGMICGALQANDRARQRRRGFRDAVREAALPDDLIAELPHPAGMQDVSAALDRLIAQAPDLDAVFCSGDTYSMGAMFAAQRRGWAVPERLAVAGLGDLDLPLHVVPSITGARVRGYRMGQLAAEMVVRRLRGETVETKVVDVGYEMFVGGSTG